MKKTTTKRKPSPAVIIGRIKKARKALEAKKGDNIVILDVREISGVTDYYLLCTGHSAPQIRALADELERTLDQAGVRCYRRAGTPESEWMVLDYVHFVAHLFSPVTREYYALEQLWKDGRPVAS